MISVRKPWPVVFVLAACSSSAPATDGGSGGDAASPEGGSFDGKNACKNLPNTATEITAMGSAAAAPAMTGGTLVDGTYFLTSRTKYGDAGWGGWKVKERLDVMNGGRYLSYVTTEAPNPEIRGGLDASSSSNDLTLDGVCADYTGQHLTMKYTATPTTFSALESNGKLSVYTKN